MKKPARRIAGWVVVKMCADPHLIYKEAELKICVCPYPTVKSIALKVGELD